MKLEFINNYFHDESRLIAFKKYAHLMFGLDFTLWEKNDLWDENYVAYSAFDGDECIASICVYPSDLIIDGQQYRGAQLLTVGTLPNYRCRGIQHEIWRSASDWISTNCDFTFLFTDQTAVGFYDKLNLKQRVEYSKSAKIPIPDKKNGMAHRKLNPLQKEEFDLLIELIRNRAAISNKISVYNPNLQMFMMLDPFRDMIYYLEDLDLAVVLQVRSTRICLIDIIGRSMPAFSELGSFLASFNKPVIEFLFSPDLLDIGETTKIELTDSLSVVSHNFPCISDSIFPYSCRA